MAIKLPHNWLESGWLDTELKQYRVLAYQKSLLAMFNRNRIYPYFKELYHHLLLLRKLKTFPVLPKYQLGPAPFLEKEDSELPNHSIIHEIVEFALPIFEELWMIANDKQDQIENQLEFFNVGITPENNKEGYLFIHIKSENQTYVFKYSKWLADVGGKYDFVKAYNHDHFLEIKKELMETQKDFGFPNVYCCSFDQYYSMKNTLMPFSDLKLNML